MVLWAAVLSVSETAATTRTQNYNQNIRRIVRNVNTKWRLTDLRKFETPIESESESNVNYSTPKSGSNAAYRYTRRWIQI